MIIENLSSETYPQIAEWGDNKAHVPVNIREIKVTNEKGELVTNYLYDLVKKVNLPITADNILEVLINSKYSKEEQSYIMKNFAKANDEKVIEYKAFLEEVQAKINKSYYK